MTVKTLLVSALPATQAVHGLDKLGHHTVRRGCHEVAPYRAGFEDALYDREYRNPYQPDTAEWLHYDQGNQDARGGKRVLL